MRIDVEPEVFRRFPGFRRAVIVARDVDNRGEPEELTALLRECEERVRSDPSLEDYRGHPRIAPWMGIFRELGLNPNKFPPSIVNLVRRARAGKPLPFVSKLVCLFNCLSLKHLGSCGGDDLGVVTGDLRLGFATGEETYVPLGEPDVREHPKPGEVIYYDGGNGLVFCRVWCWRNGDPSKIRPETRHVAINVDGMTPDTEETVRARAEELLGWVGRYCGGRLGLHLLTPEEPGFEVEE
jgi:lysyl-tRNA synthetase class 2